MWAWISIIVEGSIFDNNKKLKVMEKYIFFFNSRCSFDYSLKGLSGQHWIEKFWFWKFFYRTTYFRYPYNCSDFIVLLWFHSFQARGYNVIRSRYFLNVIKITYLLTERWDIKSTGSSKIFILGIWKYWPGLTHVRHMDIDW